MKIAENFRRGIIYYRLREVQMLQTAGLEQRCGQVTGNNNYMGSVLVTKVTSQAATETTSIS
jgi:hypothetical protein